MHNHYNLIQNMHHIVICVMMVIFYITVPNTLYLWKHIPSYVCARCVAIYLLGPDKTFVY